MTRAFRRLAPLALLSVTLLSGCGGGGGGNPLSSASPSTPTVPVSPAPVTPTSPSAAQGTLAFDVQWPAYVKPAPGVRSPNLIPAAAQSVKIAVFDTAGNKLADKIGRRPTTGNSGSVSITNVPAGNVRVTATAYPNADATGVAQATGSVTVTVVNGQTVNKTLTMGTTIDHVAITPQTPSVTPNGTTTLTATGYDRGGAIVLSGNTVWKWDLGSAEVVFAATNSRTTYRGATVTVKGVTPGSALLTLTESETGKQDTTRVKVTGIPARVSVTPSPATLAVGAAATLRATVYDRLGLVLADAPVLWTVSDPSVVRLVSNGETATLTGLVKGTTQVTAKSGSVSTVIDVRVTCTVVTVTLTPSNPVVQIGQTITLTATAKDSSGRTVAGNFQWQPPASDLAQFTVSGSTATLRGLTASHFNVSAKETGSLVTGSTGVDIATAIDHITITPATASVQVGNSVTLTAKAFDRNNNSVPTSASQWTWTPTSSSIAQLSFSGSVATVRGSSAGSVTLSVKESVSRKTAAARVTVTAASDPLASSAWPCFRGDLLNTGRGQGGSGATGTLRWQRPLPGLVGIGSAPAIGPDGTLYAVGGDAVLYALNKSTGAVLWSFDLGDLAGQGFDGPASSPAVSRGNIIFVGGAGGDLYAIDGATHRQKWHYVNGSSFYASCSPVIGPDGTVYYAPTAHGNLLAFNPATGAIRWTFGAGSEIYGTPALSASGTLYLGNASGTFYAINSVDGSTRWRFSTGNAFDYGIGGSAAIGPDGTVYFGTNGQTGGKVFALNGTTGAQKWTFSGAPFFTSPAVAPDGTVFIGSKNGGGLYALNGATGAQKWRATTGRSDSPPIYGSDGTVYVTTFTGLSAFRASTGVPLWTAPFTSDAAPAAALGSDGTLYVGNGTRGGSGILYAIH